MQVFLSVVPINPNMDLRENKVIRICLLLMITFIFFGFVIFYVYKVLTSKTTVNIQEIPCIFSENCLTSACHNVPGERKFDCFPRGIPSAEGCVARNCCWSGGSTYAGKVPQCYYSPDYKSYEMVQRTKYGLGETMLLNLTANSIYPNDVEFLKVEILHETKSRLHIKIVDALNRRYEALYPQVPVAYNSPEEMDYTLVVQESPFGFAVIQKQSGSIIFDTRGVGGFTYSDQFLQLSAILPSKYIYGLGENRNNFVLNTDWQTIPIYNDGFYSTEIGVNLYGSHPFYLSVQDSGVSYGVFLLNSNAMDIILQPAPAITYRTIGGILDFYFFMGPTPIDVIRQYTDVIGKPFFPPYWSLGFNLCRYGWVTLNDTMAAWSRTRNAGIPFDVQWTDIDYMDKHNDFTIGPNFTGLPEFVDTVHSVGMKYMLILDPGLASREAPGTYPPFDEGMIANIFIKNSSNLPLESYVWNDNNGTVFPDFTNPNITSFWTKQITDFHNLVQFDGLWVDMNEIAAFVNGSWWGCDENLNYLNYPPYVPNVQGGDLKVHTICVSAKQYAGYQYDLHNLYGYTEALLTSQVLTSLRGKRSFVLSRATFAGSGHFTAHWTGDIQSTWADLKQSVTDLINLNMYGIPMVGSDICGFSGNTTKELCTRWSLLGSFYPFARNHNDKTAIDQDPVAMNIVEPVKKALLFRYQLLPYLYTLLWQSHQNGDPVLRPLLFEFPEDVNTYTQNTQFMWGSSILIIPVLDEGATSVTSYLPKGTWFNAYTYEKVESTGHNITVNAPVDTIPVYFKAGSIIPYQDPAQTTTQSRQNPFGLYLTLDNTDEAYGVLFWDDGESNDQLAGYQYNLLQFHYSNSTITSLPLQWNYNTPMILNTVNVMGLESIVNNVFINENNYDNFKYNRNNKSLIIQETNIDLSTSFFLKWSGQNV